MLTYTLKVIQINKETEDAITLLFKQPALKKIKYLPGQYLTLIFRINGRRYLRPYSFSSSPEVDETLNITVKRVNGGIVSNHIIDKVNAGDLVEVLEPLGDFVLPRDGNIINKHLFLWGCGSGITPLFSLAKYALYKDLTSYVTLVYGNQNHDTTIFLREIEELQQQHVGRLKVVHFHTRAVTESSTHMVVRGRIAPEKVLSIIGSEINLSTTLHYICGPSGLKDSVKSFLQASAVENINIYSEDFEIIRNPDDFKDIVTRELTIGLGSNETTLEVSKGKSILEAGLDAMLELSYSCQTGDCLLCKGHLRKGAIKMIGAKKAELLKPGEYLLCCSYPLTENIHITID